MAKVKNFHLWFCLPLILFTFTTKKNWLWFSVFSKISENKIWRQEQKNWRRRKKKGKRGGGGESEKIKESGEKVEKK